MIRSVADVGTDDRETSLERLLDRAAVRNRQEPVALLGRERALELDLPLDPPDANRPGRAAWRAYSLRRIVDESEGLRWRAP